MKLTDFLREEQVIPTLSGQTKPEVLAELAHHLARAHGALDADVITRQLTEREALASTAIGSGVAIPHTKIEGIGRIIGCLGRSPRGVDFDSLDGRPTHLFFALIAPASLAACYLKALARISQLFKNPDFGARMTDAADATAMIRLLEEETGQG
jgi:PTS system nitrogen regulatory IIA component